jgi:outer membrane receptor for ferrienterochelin and colicin
VTSRNNESATENINRIDNYLRIENGNFEFLFNHAQRIYQGTTSADGITFSREHNKSEPSSTIGSLSYEHRVNDREKYNVSLGISKFIFSTFGYRGIKNGNEYYTGGKQFENLYRLTTDYVNNLSETHDINAGFEVINEGIIVDKAISNFNSSGTYTGTVNDLGNINDGPRINIFGLYVQSIKRFSRLASLTSSIRYDQHSVAGSATSPRVALLSDFGSGTRTS